MWHEINIQKSPDRRYDSIGDLLIDLKKALISPNEDFVVMVPVGQQDKTRVMKQEEVESIKEQTRNMYYEDAAEEPAKEEEQEEEEEEDDSGFLNPKMEKAVTIMGIVAAVIIVAIIIYIVGSFFGLFRFGGSDRKDKEQDKQEEIIEPEDEAEDTKDQEEQVEMIDVKGKTFEEAKDALNSIGLGIDKAGEESSDTYAQGQIVGQSVEVGVKVDKNTTILVTISSGVGEVDVPSVTGLDKETAEAKLTENGFIANVNFEYSETVANGTVISQSPEAGSKAKKGDTVTINVSRGVEPIVMINVLNKPEAEARAALSNLGLNVTTTSDYSNDVPEGNVISQSIVEGKSVEKGATVTLVISLGRKSTFYSLNNYSINKLPEIPADATSIQAVITLYRSEGEDVINTWTATSFPFSITQGNIENSSHGYIIIDWEWHYLDDEGVDVIQTQTTEIDDITFTQN